VLRAGSWQGISRVCGGLAAEIVSEPPPLAVRGTVNYFATTFSNVGDRFRGLDRWIRMRLQCMKYKRKSRADNGQIRLERFRRLGLLSLSDLRPAPA